jgi:DnaJ-class molecular chaperone
MTESCSKCNGSGWITETCPTCDGGGFNPYITSDSDYQDAQWTELYCPSCNNQPVSGGEPCSCAAGRARVGED